MDTLIDRADGVLLWSAYVALGADILRTYQEDSLCHDHMKEREVGVLDESL